MPSRAASEMTKLDALYASVFTDVAKIIESARKSAIRSVNSFMTAAYWLIGRRIVEFEQRGKKRATYGEELLEKLAADLGKNYGRGFGVDNLQRFRTFYVNYPPEQIYATVSRNSRTTVSSELSLNHIARRFALSWSAYVCLLRLKNEHARNFYETEALRSGWSVRQLERQINSQFYERTALSKNKAAMLIKGQKALPEDRVLPEEAIKDPYVLEFLDLKDEYSETELEEALIRHLETFLLELGGDFCFIGRQKRLRIGDEWYRVDLVFFHRRLRCLVIIDLKIGRFTHADAGQMHLYLNYARKHWVREDENPPVGLILCAQKDSALASYALEGLANKVLAAEYRTVLPDEKTLAREIEHTREALLWRGALQEPKTTGKMKELQKRRGGNRKGKNK